MTQRCMNTKCGRRIEHVTKDNDIEGTSGMLSITVEISLADSFQEKIKVLDFRYYCQECGSLVKTILENWEGQ